MEKITDQCAKKYQAGLEQLLQTKIKVKHHLEIKQLLLNCKSDPDFYRNRVILNDDPHSTASISLEKQVTAVCLDYLCGGSGDLNDIPKKEVVTAGERRFLQKMSRVLFDCFEESILNTSPMTLGLTTRTEDAEADRNPQSEVGFVVSMEFTLTTEFASGKIQLLFPASAFAHITKAEQSLDRWEMQTKLKQRMADVSLPLTAILGCQKITLSQAVNLKPGDILPLSEPLTAEVFISGQSFCKADVVTNNSQLMLQVCEEQDKHQLLAQKERPSEAHTLTEKRSSRRSSRRRRTARD
nr:FliM/FliN family flagellar motor switch protein [Endozoicomonas sp. OPT23]